MKKLTNLERKLKEADVTVEFDKLSNTLTCKCNKTGKVWKPTVQKGGKYAPNIWKVPC